MKALDIKTNRKINGKDYAISTVNNQAHEVPGYESCIFVAKGDRLACSVILKLGGEYYGLGKSVFNQYYKTLKEAKKGHRYLCDAEFTETENGMLELAEVQQ